MVVETIPLKPTVPAPSITPVSQTEVVQTEVIRPSSVSGRTHVSEARQNMSTNTEIYSVPLGKTLYMTDYGWTGVNSSAIGNGRINIRDGNGGDIKLSFQLATRTVGGKRPTNGLSGSLKEPLQFIDSVYLAEDNGDTTSSFWFSGYLEDTP